jgi:starch synthase
MVALKLCILSSEILPYAKTGGLADVAGSLARELGRKGHEVRAFMPLYAAVRRAHPELRPVANVTGVSVALGNTHHTFSLQSSTLPGTEVAVYFIDCPEMFDRPNLYTTDPDEHRRFLLFTRAVLESCRQLNFAPDVFQCNDWHTGFLPLYLKTLYAAEPLFTRSRSVMTVHNIGFQGSLPAAAVGDLGWGAAVSLLDQGDLAAGSVNSLKTGVKYADRVSTVSPTYAREICDTALGMGLETVLRARADGVVGILNGVDYAEWDPRHDPHLEVHFTPSDLRGKTVNKRSLLARTGLSIAAELPLIGMVTRLTEQKGIDLLVETLPAILRERQFGLLVLGSGDARYVAFFEDLARRFPAQVVFRSGYDEALAHLIEAGSDAFLMPSRYEPCGLNQMYSLRYGTIPIVRRTGGLADSVQHFDPAAGTGTGCVFNDFDAPAARWALDTVLDWFTDRRSWQVLMRNAMRQDFSWGRQVALYESLFRDL